MLKKFDYIIFWAVLSSFLLQNSYSLSTDIHKYLQVFSAKVSRNRIEPFQPLTFSGKIYHNGTTIPPFSGNASLSFDGVDDFVFFADSQSFNITAQITVSLWANTSRSGVFQRILWKHDAFGLTINPSGKIYGTVWISGVSQDSNSSLTNVADGSWHLFTYVYDGQEHRIYIDGVLESIKNQIGRVQASANDLFIGKQEEFSLYPFDGVIDDVLIYNQSLSEDEISGIFQGTFENKTGMVAHWSFDGDALDKSGNGNDGIIYEATWADGWANVHVYLELNGLLKKNVNLVNSTNGNFVFPHISGESEYGTYNYTIYVKSAVQNQTLTVVVGPPLPPEITILSPENMTYATNSIALMFTVDKPVSWIGYSLDGNVNLTISGNTTLQGLSTGTHSIAIYADSVRMIMGSSETIYFMVDIILPTVVSVHRQPEHDVTREQKVKISANVTDVGSGVAGVILLYSVDKGTSWNNITMNYNTATGMYEETIPAQPLGTTVNYRIIAYDRANNAAINENARQYIVIQEFPTINLLALFILLALIVIIIINKNKEALFSLPRTNNSSR